MPLSDRLLKVENVELKTMTHASGTMPAAQVPTAIRQECKPPSTVLRCAVASQVVIGKGIAWSASVNQLDHADLR